MASTDKLHSEVGEMVLDITGKKQDKGDGENEKLLRNNVTLVTCSCVCA